MLSSQCGRLSRRQAVPLAVGSIAGSGVLVLPSAVYAASGRDSGWVWLCSAALCLPMLVLFRDVVRSAPPGRGMEWVIARGLGAPLGRCVPVLFVAVVTLGLPGGALVAGAYARRALSAGPLTAAAVAAIVLAMAVGVTLAGAQVGARVQRLSTWVLVVVVGLVAVLALVNATPGGLRGAAPGMPHLGSILPQVVLAFWAFAGFENLTFLSAELRRPHQDLLPVGAAALALYAGLTVVLTTAIATAIPRGQVDPLTGLLQLADHLPVRGPVVAAVLATAVVAMTMNAVAWTWGVSRLVARAADDRILPRALARTGPGGTPIRAVLLLAVLFVGSAAVLAVRPTLVVPAISAASSVFLVLYALAIVAYLRVRRVSARSAVVLAPLALILPSLARSGWTVLYAPVVAAAALAAQIPGGLRARRAVGRARGGQA